MSDDRGTTGLSRRQLIKRGAVVGGAAIWVPPVIQSLRMPAHAQQGSPVSCIVDGFMTGGGFIDVAGVGRVHYQLLGLDCPPQTSPPELKVTWGSNKNGSSFQLQAFTSRTCSDNPAIQNGPEANFDTATGTGTGTLIVSGGTPQTGTVNFEFVDGGEGQNSSDTVTIIITDAANNVVLSIVNQLVDGGNLQAHHGNFAFGDACP